MLTRRTILARCLHLGLQLGFCAALATPLAFALPRAGHAQTAAQLTDSTAFIQQTGNRMVDVVDGSQDDAQKRAAMQQLVDQSVDVDQVGRFCLGRYWRTATPQQQQDYLRLFHIVLMNNVTSKIGEYRGVTFAMTRTTSRDGNAAVGTTVTRPNNAPNNVQWIVGFTTGSPKIIDVIAEGTSLRLTQRSDYSSYLARNNNDVAALIAAMKQQVGG